jgi:signal transduction histidine kinase
MVSLGKFMDRIALNKKLSLFCIAILCGIIAYLDYATPLEIPTDAFYALPIWLGLLSFGLGGGFGVATGAIILFYFSNFLLSGARSLNLWPALGLNYVIFVLFAWGAWQFLQNQRQLDKTRQDLQARVEELHELYQRSERLHQQNLKLAITEERNRLAREIHDVLAQGLTAIILQTEAAQLNRSDLVALERRLAQINELAHRNLQEARRSVANLRPLPLDGSSLLEALERKVQEFGNEQQIATSFTSSGPVQRLPNEVETALYRVAQEAFSNVARHSKATNVQVTLDYDEDELCLTVQDNGQGFEVSSGAEGVKAKNDTGKTFGLSTMQERARLVGGWITIQSSPGQGCRIRVIVPYHKTREMLRGSDPVLAQQI